MTAKHDTIEPPGRLADIVLRLVTADDMTQVHDAWSPEEAGDSYEYGGFRLYATTFTEDHVQHVHLYRAEDLNPVLSRDPSEQQLLIWLAETFTIGEAVAVIDWTRAHHPEFGDFEWYDVDAGRWPSSPLPASWVKDKGPRLDFSRDPTFPLDTRVKAVVLNHTDASAAHARIVPSPRDAPPYEYSESERLRTRHDGRVTAFRPDGWVRC